VTITCTKKTEKKEKRKNKRKKNGREENKRKRKEERKNERKRKEKKRKEKKENLNLLNARRIGIAVFYYENIISAISSYYIILYTCTNDNH